LNIFTPFRYLGIVAATCFAKLQDNCAARPEQALSRLRNPDRN
jgi:hypothetical protein